MGVDWQRGYLALALGVRLRLDVTMESALKPVPPKGLKLECSIFARARKEEWPVRWTVVYIYIYGIWYDQAFELLKPLAC